MAISSSSSRHLLRKRSFLKSNTLLSISLLSSSSSSSLQSLLEPSKSSLLPAPTISSSSRVFCSRPLNFDETQVPASIDYRSFLEEDEYHNLADATIEDLQEKFEEYGDCVQVDGFDIDYGNQVLTLKLGNLGTYVLNKQTPNRQLWLSSPVSGPSRFDWDRSSKAWVYRRTKANLLQLLESEMKQLCEIHIYHHHLLPTSVACTIISSRLSHHHLRRIHDFGGSFDMISRGNDDIAVGGGERERDIARCWRSTSSSSIYSDVSFCNCCL